MNDEVVNKIKNVYDMTPYEFYQHVLNIQHINDPDIKKIDLFFDLTLDPDVFGYREALIVLSMCFKEIALDLIGFDAINDQRSPYGKIYKMLFGGYNYIKEDVVDEARAMLFGLMYFDKDEETEDHYDCIQAIIDEAECMSHIGADEGYVKDVLHKIIDKLGCRWFTRAILQYWPIPLAAEYLEYAESATQTNSPTQGEENGDEKKNLEKHVVEQLENRGISTEKYLPLYGFYNRMLHIDIEEHMKHNSEGFLEAEYMFFKLNCFAHTEEQLFKIAAHVFEAIVKSSADSEPVPLKLEEKLKEVVDQLKCWPDCDITKLRKQLDWVFDTYPNIRGTRRIYDLYTVLNWFAAQRQEGFPEKEKDIAERLYHYFDEDVCNDTEFIKALLKDWPAPNPFELGYDPYVVKVAAKPEEPVCDNKTSELIVKKCDEIKELLLTKNRKYGNSALEPVRIFSKLDPEDQLLVRIDDKLSRIKNRQNDEDEDVIKDLAGYLVLLMVRKEMKNV